MKDLMVLIGICIFWFSQVLVIGSMVSGGVFDNVNNNQTYNIIDTSNVNFNLTQEDTTNPSNILDMFSMMFGFRNPQIDNDVLAPILSFINWLLVLVSGVLIYKLIRGISS